MYYVAKLGDLYLTKTDYFNGNIISAKFGSNNSKASRFYDIENDERMFEIANSLRKMGIKFYRVEEIETGFE